MKTSWWQACLSLPGHSEYPTTNPHTFPYFSWNFPSPHPSSLPPISSWLPLWSRDDLALRSIRTAWDLHEIEGFRRTNLGEFDRNGTGSFVNVQGCRHDVCTKSSRGMSKQAIDGKSVLSYPQTSPVSICVHIFWMSFVFLGVMDRTSWNAVVPRRLSWDYRDFLWKLTKHRTPWYTLASLLPYI